MEISIGAYMLYVYIFHSVMMLRQCDVQIAIMVVVVQYNYWAGYVLTVDVLVRKVGINNCFADDKTGQNVLLPRKDDIINM